MKYIPLFILLIVLVISFLVIKLVKYIFIKITEEKVVTIYFDEKLKKRKGYFSFKRINKYLKSKGQPFGITPSTFIFIKLGLAMLFFFMGRAEGGIIIGIGLGVLGFFVFDYIINISNASDNEKLAVDLSEIYDCLRIQNKGGVFIQNSLNECFLIAKNKRLKKALKELNNQIAVTKDIESSLDEFNSKFDCVYIDTFVMTIKQGLKTGKKEDAFNDISEALKETALVIEERKGKNIERKIQALNMAIFIFIIALTIYGIFMEFQRDLLNF